MTDGLEETIAGSSVVALRLTERLAELDRGLARH
jgi:hypothetical protein